MEGYFHYLIENESLTYTTPPGGYTEISLSQQNPRNARNDTLQRYELDHAKEGPREASN
jgi:hypothetical protein